VNVDFTATHRYDHPADAVFALLTDFDAVKEKYEALGHRDVKLVRREAPADGSVTMVTTRVVPMEVPGFAKKFLKPTNNVTQTDSWGAPDADGVRTGTYAVDAKGVPVTLGGTLRLAPDGDGCTNEIRTTITSKVPLVGGKLADFVGGDAKKAVAHEQTWTTARLTGG
jgi:Protein of unknown function (DUF2505)